MQGAACLGRRQGAGPEGSTIFSKAEPAQPVAVPAFGSGTQECLQSICLVAFGTVGLPSWGQTLTWLSIIKKYHAAGGLCSGTLFAVEFSDPTLHHGPWKLPHLLEADPMAQAWVLHLLPLFPWKNHFPCI